MRESADGFFCMLKYSKCSMYSKGYSHLLQEVSHNKFPYYSKWKLFKN